MIGFIGTYLRLHTIITAHTLNSFWTTSVWRIPMRNLWLDLMSSRVGQSASVSWNKALIWGIRPDIYYCQTVGCLLMWGALSDERTGLSFTIPAGPRQCRHSRVRVPWDSYDHILLPQIWDFPFCHLLRLTGLRWKYSTPPPHQLTTFFNCQAAGKEVTLSNS
jgi:hypothetical protein